MYNIFMSISIGKVYDKIDNYIFRNVLTNFELIIIGDNSAE